MKMMFLSRADIEKVLDMKSTIEGVREVYRLKSLGQTAVWDRRRSGRSSHTISTTRTA